MIIFLYGPDSYHRQKKLKEIIAQYQKKHSNLALEKFDLELAGEWEKLKSFTTAQSLFNDLKMGVVNLANGEWLMANGESRTANSSDFKDLLEKQLETKNFCLVISVDEILKKEFNFLLKKPVLFQEFKNLTGLKWKKFIEEQVKERGLLLTASISSLVAEGDCYGLVNELDKAELKNSSDGGIASGALTTVGDPHNDIINDNIDFFSSIQKLARGDLQTQLPVLERLLNNEDAGKIFNILAYSVSPERQIKMADYDVVVKSGKLEYEEAILDFILKSARCAPDWFSGANSGHIPDARSEV